MKEAELRNHTTCSLCHKKIMACGLPLFWRLTIERFGIDIRAIQRQDGLSQIVGSSAIASVMGPNEDLASPVQEATILTICEKCAMENECVAKLFHQY